MKVALVIGVVTIICVTVICMTVLVLMGKGLSEVAPLVMVLVPTTLGSVLQLLGQEDIKKELQQKGSDPKP
jgi:flagellar biosynthesis/type III secretory pathway M-ring protein FliF/YscJ